jgi:hypothetical protein
MGAFDAIKKAEAFGKTYAQKRDILAVAHTQGEYDDEPSMKSGRYDETGRRRKDGRKRIQGYTAAQRYTSMADRDAKIASDMTDLRFRNDPEKKVIGKQGVGGATYAGPRTMRQIAD